MRGYRLSNEPLYFILPSCFRFGVAIEGGSGDAPCFADRSDLLRRITPQRLHPLVFPFAGTLGTLTFRHVRGFLKLPPQSDPL